MSWQNSLTIAVRVMVNDFGLSSSNQQYNDSKIQTAICVAGLLVSQEYDFGQVFFQASPHNSNPIQTIPNYTFDLENLSITPDPTLSDTYDPTAIALWSLKAACIINQDQYQGAIAGGIRVKDGDSMVDTVDGLKSYSDLIKVGPCAAYEKTKKYLAFKASMLRGKAVSGPFSSYDFLITNSFNLQVFFDSFLLR